MLKFKQNTPDRPLAKANRVVILGFMSAWLKRGVGVVIALLALLLVGSNAWLWSAGWGRFAAEP